MHLLYIYIWLWSITGMQVEKKLDRISAHQGTVTFISDAPLETISATSNQLKGVIDTSNNSFAFTVGIGTFSGFNSPLQMEHFNENYMESVSFPKASFSGKIIENTNFDESGTNEVRAKGILEIHGIKHERLIKARIDVFPGEFVVSSEFVVSLNNHNIKIPRIVNQKIASDIKVNVKCYFKK